MIDVSRFADATEELVSGALREAVGYRVDGRIPYFRGIVGYLVEAPMLWISKTRFPILFVAFDSRKPTRLEDVERQVQLSGAAERFAVLIVVPTRHGYGVEGDELRRIVKGSSYGTDFVVLDRALLESIITHNSADRLISIMLEQGVGWRRLSPYIVHGAVPDRMFFGRETELKTVVQALGNQSHAIVGGRRIGKSSMQRKLRVILDEDPRYCPYYVNCEKITTSDGFFDLLVDELKQPLDLHDPQALRRLVHQLAAPHPACRVVFLFDEIDELLDSDARSDPPCRLFGTMRALAHEEKCRFVFTGNRVLHHHIHDAASPFFNFCAEMVLGLLDYRSVAEIVRRPMARLGVELNDEERIIERMIEVTERHPNLVQWVCDSLLKNLTDPVITSEKLEQVVSDHAYSKWFVDLVWKDLRPIEKLISLLPEHDAFTSFEIRDRLASFGVGDQRAIHDALDMLEVLQLFERTRAGYRFGLKSFPRLVREEFDDVDYEIRTALTEL